ncbi:MAG: putative sulfate/molybdate transporter [Acidobacteria bacterium]|nr:putative sulfate/molybdate transporter [Acidobacteriota bacterium]
MPIRFDRNEFSGAFGDIGTDFALVTGIILAAHLDVASALIMFGLMQVLTGLMYGIPMPAQPLKAMAVLVIAQKISGSILFGAGLAIGMVMLLLSVTGAIDWLARVVPRVVIRGIQLGLGIQLALIALRDYVPAEGRAGYILAAVAFAVAVALLGNRKFPPAALIIGLGIVYACIFKIHAADLVHGFGISLPRLNVPSHSAVWQGFVLLALPQIPLSLGNSILATRQVAEDLFPAKQLTVRKIGLTYSLMNLVNPFFSGIPTCHGSGGMVGHYTFGARTGGSVLIYGSIYLILGLFFSRAFGTALYLFPLPVLGVILFIEGVNLALLVRDTASSRSALAVVLLTALMCVGLPYGYVVGLVAGTALAHLAKRNLVRLGCLPSAPIPEEAQDSVDSPRPKAGNLS